MQRLNSEGNAASPPWRSHQIEAADGTTQMVTEPLDTDQTLFFPGKFAEDNYPISTGPNATWITFPVGKTTHRVGVDKYTLHEWWGHTHGKGERQIGALPDHYWHNRFDLRTLLAQNSASSPFDSMFFEPTSLMNMWIENPRLTPIDIFQSDIRGRYSPNYGGIHTDGSPIIDWPDVPKSELYGLFPQDGYRISVNNLGGADITHTACGGNILNLDYHNQNPPIRSYPTQSNTQNGIIIYRNTHELDHCNYLLLTADNGVTLPIPRPMLQMATASSIHAPETPINIVANSSDDRIHYPTNTNEMYITSVFGKPRTDELRQNPNNIAWMTIPNPNNSSNRDMTFIWTTERPVTTPPQANKNEASSSTIRVEDSEMIDPRARQRKLEDEQCLPG